MRTVLDEFAVVVVARPGPRPHHRPTILAKLFALDTRRQVLIRALVDRPALRATDFERAFFPSHLTLLFRVVSADGHFKSGT